MNRTSNLQPLTLRQAKLMARKAAGAFSCYIDAPNGYYGRSTIWLDFGRIVVDAPYEWHA